MADHADLMLTRRSVYTVDVAASRIVAWTGLPRCFSASLSAAELIPV